MFAQLQNSRRDQESFPEWMEGIGKGVGRIPAQQVEGAAQGSVQGWKNLPKLLSKFPFLSLIVLERLEWGKGGFGVYSQEKQTEVVRGRSFGAWNFFSSWSKISSLGQQLLFKALVCVEIGKMNWQNELGNWEMKFPKELQGLAELHPSWLSQIHPQAQGIFNGMQSQALFPYLEMEQGSKLIPAQTLNWLLKARKWGLFN